MSTTTIWFCLFQHINLLMVKQVTKYNLYLIISRGTQSYLLVLGCRWHSYFVGKPHCFVNCVFHGTIDLNVIWSLYNIILIELSKTFNQTDNGMLITIYSPQYLQTILYMLRTFPLNNTVYFLVCIQNNKFKTCQNGYSLTRLWTNKVWQA